MATTGTHEQPSKASSLKEQHKLGRIFAVRAARNSKGTAYLNSKFQMKQSHNFTGDFIEKMVYSNGKVKIYDRDGKPIKEEEKEVKAKPAKKDKASYDMPDSNDVQSS
jgi:hypothetical protein